MTRLGKYDLFEALGRGGYGTVYRAQDKVLNVERAVKVLNPALTADPDFITRFRQEVQVAARLEHPNIVPVYDLGEEEGRFFLAMRLMPSGSLKDRLGKEGQLPFDAALKIIQQVSSALDFAFQQPEKLAVLEALENGVPLTVELHLQVRREGAWVWEPDVVDSRLRSQIRFSPLLGTYQVTNVETGQHRTFARRDRAISALGEVKDLTVVRADALDPDETYRVEMRATLDIESLPLPLRPKAYLSPDWNLSSEWNRWRLRP